MTSGKLRERVTIQQATEATAESGQTSETWSTYVYAYADVRTTSGKEFFAEDKYNSHVTHTVMLRWRDGITEKMRVLWGTRILNIIYVGEDRTHERSMILNCVEVKS